MIVKEFFQIAAIILCTRIWQLVNITFVVKAEENCHRNVQFIT